MSTTRKVVEWGEVVNVDGLRHLVIQTTRAHMDEWARLGCGVSLRGCHEVENVADAVLLNCIGCMAYVVSRLPRKRFTG